MDIDTITKIIEISDTGSINKAAENLYISQPHLSNILKTIENQLGFTIFERTNRGVITTKDGAIFIEKAKSLLNQFNLFANSFTNYHKNVKTISISARRSSYISLSISRFIDKFANKDSSVLVRFYECTNQQVINNIFNGNSSIGILRFDENYKNHFDNQLISRYIKWDQIYECNTVALMSKDHELASKEVISLNELNKYVEIIHGDFEDNYFYSLDINKQTNTYNKIYVYERGSLLDFISNIHGSYTWTTATHPNILEKYSLVEKQVTQYNNKVIDYLIYKENINKKILNLLHSAVKETLIELKEKE